MKKLLVVLLFSAPALSAQTLPHDLQQAPPPQVFSSAQTILTPGDWVKIGGPFGPHQTMPGDAKGAPSGPRSWQFGFDKSATAGVCMARDLAHGAYLGGACRDLFVLAHRQRKTAQLGVLFGWDSTHAHSAILGRLGVHVGDATAAAANFLADKIPGLEAVAEWKAPPALQYLDKVTEVDGVGGPYRGADRGSWAYGYEVKADVPLADIWALLGGK